MSNKLNLIEKCQYKRTEKYEQSKTSRHFQYFYVTLLCVGCFSTFADVVFTLLRVPAILSKSQELLRLQNDI